MNQMTTDTSPFDAAAFTALYAERLDEFHLAWSVFLLRYTASLRKAVGDMDDASLLVALTVVSTTSQTRANAADGFHGTEGPFTNGTPPPTNAARLSDISGIPRETVRRRLVAMARRGWVEQGEPPPREWRLTIGPTGWPIVAQEFGAMHAEFMRDLSRLLGRWDQLARAAGWAGLTQSPGRAAPAALLPSSPRPRTPRPG